jgi:glutaminyl-tRNA synthetase
MNKEIEKKDVPSNFIRNIIDEDLKNNKNNGEVHTRFPPEPNGYLHIGHAKSICLNFGIAKDYNGMCNLRFDDTNPAKEDVEYVDSIIEDVHWLGFDWDDRMFYASNYYDKLYEYAVYLIKEGKAFVCDLNAEEMRKYRGTLTEPGKESPYKNRTIEENLELFEKMKNGEFEDGTHTLRAKIDMASPNLNMRDPVIYRIIKTEHHRTGNKWCIYPMYDYTHCISDSIEGITHSLCTLEFEDHRPLYDWFLDQLPVKHHPQQIEFARLNLGYTIMSKRKLLELVEKKIVTDWDDPRMPTIAGLRRRGYTPKSIRDFADRIGVAKADSTVDLALLEYCIREDLNKIAKRVMVVLDPIKVIIDNYPEDKVEWMEAINNPENENDGSRKIPFTKELFIERDDFMENPPRKYFRMTPGKEVRLKHAYYLMCESVVKDENDNVVEIHCTYDPATKGGWSDDGRKVKGTLHWVSSKYAINAELRIYDHLFLSQNPEENGNYLDNINPNSLSVNREAKLEPSLKEAKAGDYFQFLRKGYFCLDSKDSSKSNLVFNKTVGLRDSWSKKHK